MRISDWSSDVCSSDLVALPAGKGARPGSTATCLGDADRRSAKLRQAESQPRTDLVDRREIIRPALGDIEAVAFARLGQKGDVRCAVLDQGDMIGHAGARILVEQGAVARARLPDARDIASTRVAGLDCADQPVASLHQEDEAGVGLALLTQGCGEPLAREPKLRSEERRVGTECVRT